MKETNEMFKILSENKKRVQQNNVILKQHKDHALDIAGTIWTCIGFIICVYLISLI